MVTFETAFVYYNSYLPRIAPPERTRSRVGHRLRRRLRGLAGRLRRRLSVRGGQGVLGLLPRRGGPVRDLRGPGLRRPAARHAAVGAAGHRHRARRARDAGHAARDPRQPRPDRDPAVPDRVPRLRGRREHRHHLRGGLRRQDARLLVRGDHRPLHPRPDQRARRLAAVGAADRPAGAAAGGAGHAGAVGAGDGARLLRAGEVALLGGGGAGRHRPRRRAGRQPHVHGHADPEGPRGGVLRLLLAGRQDRRRHGPGGVRRRLACARRQPAGGHRRRGPLLRRRAGAPLARAVGRAHGGRRGLEPGLAIRRHVEVARQGVLERDVDHVDPADRHRRRQRVRRHRAREVRRGVVERADQLDLDGVRVGRRRHDRPGAPVPERPAHGRHPVAGVERERRHHGDEPRLRLGVAHRERADDAAAVVHRPRADEVAARDRRRVRLVEAARRHVETRERRHVGDARAGRPGEPHEERIDRRRRVEQDGHPERARRDRERNRRGRDRAVRIQLAALREGEEAEEERDLTLRRERADERDRCRAGRRHGQGAVREVGRQLAGDDRAGPRRHGGAR